MDVGIFVEEMPHGSDQAGAFRDVLDLADAGEAWGLDGLWLGEMHGNPARSVLSAPLLVAAAIAGRTRRLRVGTAVHLLPLHNPLRVAEEVATVDHLSQGRFELGIGRSGSPRAYDAFGIPYTESQARFAEALEIIREAWRGEPFSYHGTYYRFENATVAPRPYQVPHPPIRIAATDEATFVRVGRMGLPIFVGLRRTDIPELRSQVQAYRAAWRDAGCAGEPDVCLRIPLYAGTTDAAALDEPRESITYYFRRQAELTQAVVGRAGTGPAELRQSQARHLAELSYEEILTTKVAFGTAKALIDRLAELREELALSGIVAELNPGGRIPPERVRRSLRLLTHEVLPALR